jgi:DNA mismatch endonuclease (patch repair protein)
MADVVPPERSHIMRSVGRQHTRPEMVVRRVVHALGGRYRLHRGNLPGKPDLVFPGKRKVIFVHGCFWHHHEGCSKASLPKTRTEFWAAKFDRNRARDARVAAELQEKGWHTLVVWECETRDPAALEKTLRAFLDLRSGRPLPLPEVGGSSASARTIVRRTRQTAVENR